MTQVIDVFLDDGPTFLNEVSVKTIWARRLI